MSQEGNVPSWLLALLGVLPSAGILAWHRFFTERSDKRKESISELRDRVRSTMDTQSLAMYDRLEAENKRLVERLAELEIDRNRGWDLTRWWNANTHRVKHVLVNLLQISNGRLEKIAMIFAELDEQGGHITERQLADIKRVSRPVDVPSLRLPDIEDPIPRHTYRESRRPDGLD